MEILSKIGMFKTKLTIFELRRYVESTWSNSAHVHWKYKGLDYNVSQTCDVLKIAILLTSVGHTHSMTIILKYR